MGEEYLGWRILKFAEIVFPDPKEVDFGEPVETEAGPERLAPTAVLEAEDFTAGQVDLEVCDEARVV